MSSSRRSSPTEALSRLSQENCQGTQTSQWSRDGERLFTRVELTCAGRPARVVSGITLMPKGHWIDTQATMIDGDHDVRLRRYQRTSDQYTGGPAIASAPMSVEDVIEASAKVLSPALEAALVESEASIHAEQPRADAARRYRRLAERHRCDGRAGLSGERSN